MIDEISWKILNELSIDGRITNADLAAKLGINASTAAKKVNSMIEEGILTIKAVPNRVKMGYHFGAVIGLDVMGTKLERVCTQIIEDHNVNVVVTCFGRFDAIIVVNFLNKELFHDYLVTLKQMEGVNNVETYLVLESLKQHHDTFNNEKSPNDFKAIDETDQAIIKELMRNGRFKHSDLARKLGIDSSTVSRRINYLIKEDLIKIVGNPTPSKLGYSANAFIMLSADQTKVNDICIQLYKYHEVHMVMKLLNGYDILFGVHFPDPDSLFEFVQNKIATIDGVLNTETFIRGNFFYFGDQAISLPSIWHSMGPKPSSN